MKQEVRNTSDIYAEPRHISKLSDCYFYHTMEIPGYGPVTGEWDLRDGIRAYTGELDFNRRRVLEVGTASGFVCFYMESQGADVVAYDIDENQSWDIVPLSAIDAQSEVEKRRRIVRQMNDGYWLAHRAFGSKAKVVYGTAYDIPAEIGQVDISTFCSVLVHLRDPFLALCNAAQLTRDTILVTDVLNPNRASPERDAHLPFMEFIPDFRVGGPFDAWWFLNPQVIEAFLGVLGFGNTRITYHSQRFSDGERAMFSITGRRTNAATRS